jgi:hypothetical protein
MEEDEVMDGYDELSGIEYRHIEVGKMDQIKIESFKEFGKPQLFFQGIPSEIRQDFPEIRDIIRKRIKIFPS